MRLSTNYLQDYHLEVETKLVLLALLSPVLNFFCDKFGLFCRPNTCKYVREIVELFFSSFANSNIVEKV